MATFLIGSHYNYLEANWTVSIALKDTYIRAKRNGTDRKSKEHHPSLHQGHYAGKWGHYGERGVAQKCGQLNGKSHH